MDFEKPCQCWSVKISSFDLVVMFLVDDILNGYRKYILYIFQAYLGSTLSGVIFIWKYN